MSETMARVTMSWRVSEMVPRILLDREAATLQVHWMQRLDISFISSQDLRPGVSLGRDEWILDDR